MDIQLTPEERERFDIIRSCIDSDIVNAEAAARLRLSVRQVRRLKRKVEKYGEVGIVHGLSGTTSPLKTGDNIVKQIIKHLKKKECADFCPTFAQEQLHKQGIAILSRETIRTIMAEHDLWKPRERKSRAVHREWRERRAMRGQLVQFDGSYHDWFENGSKECLLAAIDDADNSVVAVFEKNEGVQAVFRFWWAYFLSHGLPVAIYLDKFSTYKINHKSAVDNEKLMTQFKRAMTDLDVEVITAHSPEAKGRVERLFGTLQDRLVKEMRLANISNREEANIFLEKTYLPDHHARFTVVPRSKGDAHRPLTDTLRAQLPAIFSVQSTRTVNNDFTIRFKNRWFQLSETQPTTVYKRDAVTIEERLDDTVHIRHRDAYLSYSELPDRPRAERMRVTALTGEKQMWKPPVDHPWRRSFSKKSRRADEKPDNVS